DANGVLTLLSSIPTGGRGGVGNGVDAVDPLGSQHSLILSRLRSQLLVVNAGSNQGSSLAVDGGALRLRSLVDSGGAFPNSIAWHNDFVYVLNAQGTPNIAGFRISPDGVLKPIPGAIHDLPGGKTPIPHDIRFSPDGTRVLVSDEAN